MTLTYKRNLNMAEVINDVKRLRLNSFHVKAIVRTK